MQYAVFIDQPTCCEFWGFFLLKQTGTQLKKELPQKTSLIIKCII